MSTSKKNQNQANQKKTNHNNKNRSRNSSRKNGKFKRIRQRIKRAIAEETAGGVVFRHTDQGVEILMIQDAKNRWTIPKGHVEEGESLEETAVREIEEETGLGDLKILDRLGKIDFRYRKADNLILMTMHVFLIHAYKNTDDYVPEESEGIKDVAWWSVNEALDKIEYDDIGKLILIGLKKIRNARH